MLKIGIRLPRTTDAPTKKRLICVTGCQSQKAFCLPLIIISATANPKENQKNSCTLASNGPVVHTHGRLNSIHLAQNTLFGEYC